MERLKRAFKNINLYMAVSALIVLISLIIINLLLWDTVRPEEEPEDMLIVLESEEEDNGETIIDAESEEIEIAEASESSIASEPLEAWVTVEPEEQSVVEPEEQSVAEPEEIELPEPMKQEEAKTEESKVQETPQEPQNETVTAPTEIQPPLVEETEEPEVAEPPKECNHSWIFSSYYQEPACSSGGLENQICIRCGAGQTMPGTATGQHIFVTETEGDCCGDEIVICKDCNYREVRGKKADNHIDVEDGFCYGCGMKISPPAE